jgi:hypothetical protein
MLKDIISVQALENHQLHLKFEENQEGVVDIRQIIELPKISPICKIQPTFCRSKSIPTGGQFIGKMDQI